MGRLARARHSRAGICWPTRHSCVGNCWHGELLRSRGMGEAVQRCNCGGAACKSAEVSEGVGVGIGVGAGKHFRWRVAGIFSGLGSQQPGARFGCSGSGTGAGTGAGWPEPEPGADNLNLIPDGRDPGPENEITGTVVTRSRPYLRGGAARGSAGMGACCEAEAAITGGRLGQHAVLPLP